MSSVSWDPFSTAWLIQDLLHSSLRPASIAFRHLPPKEGCRKPVLGVCILLCLSRLHGKGYGAFLGHWCTLWLVPLSVWFALVRSLAWTSWSQWVCLCGSQYDSRYDTAHKNQMNKRRRRISVIQKALLISYVIQLGASVTKLLGSTIAPMQVTSSRIRVEQTLRGVCCGSPRAVWAGTPHQYLSGDGPALNGPSKIKSLSILLRTVLETSFCPVAARRGQAKHLIQGFKKEKRKKEKRFYSEFRNPVSWVTISVTGWTKYSQRSSLVRQCFVLFILLNINEKANHLTLCKLKRHFENKSLIVGFYFDLPLH